MFSTKRSDLLLPSTIKNNKLYRICRKSCCRSCTRTNPTVELYCLSISTNAFRQNPESSQSSRLSDSFHSWFSTCGSRHTGYRPGIVQMYRENSARAWGKRLHSQIHHFLVSRHFELRTITFPSPLVLNTLAKLTWNDGLLNGWFSQ